MLSDQVRQLLVAYVEGDLPAAQKQSALRLLEKSAEAQEFVSQLQADGAAIRRLPRRQLGADFPQKIVSAIGERITRERSEQPADITREDSPLIIRDLPLRSKRKYLDWIVVAAAASVLILVGFGALYYFHDWSEIDQRRLVVARNDANRPAKLPNAGEGAKEKVVSPIPTKEKQALPESSGFPKVEENDQEPVATAKAPALEFTPEADIAMTTEPTRRFEVFKELDQAGGFSLRLTLRDLDQPGLQERLKETLKDDKAFHFDLACPSTTKGLDRLQTVLQAEGVKLLIDKAALTRWKKGLKTHYALYSEDLTPEELTTILQALGADDKKANPDQRFNKIVINHLGSANRTEICTLLGVDPRTLAAKPKGPLGVDITQPLSKKTEEQVADALAGKGPPRPEPGKAATPKGPERIALVLSYNPVRVSPASSKEIKQFLATRLGQRPGAVRILLVLRGRLV